MSNQLIPQTWGAACARPVMESGSAVTLASLSSAERARYASIESGRVRLGGADLRMRHVLGMFPALQTNAQLKGAAKGAAVGPYPWWPTE